MSSRRALRHTMASIADDVGMPIGTIAAGLGHARERTTESFYRDQRRLRIARTAQQAFADEMLADRVVM
jgi:integrase